MCGLIAISLVLAGLVVVRRKYPLPRSRSRSLGSIQVAAGHAPGRFPAGECGPAIIVLLYTLAAYRPRRTPCCGLLVCLIGIAMAVLRSPAQHGTPTPCSSARSWSACRRCVPGCSGTPWRYRRAHRRVAGGAGPPGRGRTRREGPARGGSRTGPHRPRDARHHRAQPVGDRRPRRRRPVRRRTLPERASQALGAIGSTGRQALSETAPAARRAARARRPSRRPRPAARHADLETLARPGTGRRPAGATATVRGDPRRAAERRQLDGLPDRAGGADQHPQARRPAATAEVTLDYADGAVDVRDHRRPARRGSRRRPTAATGLPGMRERAAVYGGTLHGRPGARTAAGGSRPTTCPRPRATDGGAA